MLALLPKGLIPNYCATKAALHSLCISLHNSLKDTNVHVMEIMPPLVSLLFLSGFCADSHRFSIVLIQAR